jgi:hemoglobin
MKRDILERSDIELLVDSFYEKVQQDELIGHIFTDVAKVDWSHHLPKMYDFWETILFGQKAFKGNPMAVHFNLNNHFPLQEDHFNRWKSIFFATVDEHFEGESAEQAKVKAQSIADLMLFKISQLPNQGINIIR